MPATSSRVPSSHSGVSKKPLTEMSQEEFLVLAGAAPFYRRLLAADYVRACWEREARYQYAEVFYAEATWTLLGEDTVRNTTPRG